MQLAKPLNLEIRPQTFFEYIGQDKIKNTLNIIIGASKIQKRVLPHLLLYGAPGTGKTTLASIVANHSDMHIKYTQGSMFEKKTTLLNVFGSLSENTILFIDEIHSIPLQVQELLYSIMEDFTIDIVLGVEANTKIVRMKVKPFTLIGATTKLEWISKPLKDRFGYLSKMSPYTISDLKKIIKNNAKKLKLKITQENATLIAQYSQLTPRIANHLLMRIHDYLIYNSLKSVDNDLILKIFNDLGLYEFGLNEDHIKYLQTLSEVFLEKHASIDAISGILNISKESIHQQIEPSLLFLNLIIKGPRGRKISEKGINFLINNVYEKKR